MSEFKFDEIGYWSEVKLEIIKEYASAYGVAFANRPYLSRLYIDGFAGAGVHISKTTKESVPGSPTNALLVEPPFHEYHFVDLNTGKANNLRQIAGDRLNRDVFVYEGDCNDILLNLVFPRVRYEDYRRALCILDPYGLHLNWEVIKTAGKLGTIDLFLNFPIMDMNRNALWRDAAGVDPEDAARMTAFWGDDTWRQAAYREEEHLFGFDDVKGTNEDIVKAFKDRLRTVAGFKNVLDPMPMRNTRGATVYYLFFASAKDTANKIARDIFRKYSNKGAGNG